MIKDRGEVATVAHLMLEQDARRAFKLVDYGFPDYSLKPSCSGTPTILNADVTEAARRRLKSARFVVLAR